MDSNNNNDEPSEPFSTLPWHWVMEALAGFKEITTSTLQGLIDAAPVRTDNFGENTKELIAMRCLEEIYASSSSFSSSTLDSRVGLDFSRTCDGVLQEILREVPLSNLRISGAQLLKWDVKPFIKYRRADNVKCHLEQLKESILEGTVPLTDHLKERSGLFQINHARTVCVNDGKCKDQSVKDDGNSAYAEDLGAKESSASLILGDGNKSSKECLPDNNRLSSRRNMVYSADENFMSCLNEKQVCINECDDSLRSTKRIKRNASTNFDSKKEKKLSRLGKEVSENLTEKYLPIFENVGHHTEKNNRETLSDGPLQDSHNRCTASNLCQSSSQKEVFHDESGIPFNASLTPMEKTSGSKPWFEHEADLQLEDSNGYQQTVSSDKAQDGTGNIYGIEISGDTVAYQGENVNLLLKKHNKKSFDTNCNEGGQALVCEATTVPLLAPESCIGMKTNIYPPHTSGVEPCQNKFMDETNDTVHVEPIPANDGNANIIQHMTNETQPKQKEPNVESLSASKKPASSDKAAVDAAKDCGAELSSDSDGYHNEKIDLVAKKDEILSSQHTFGQDLSAMAELDEQNLCMKCNEAGQLLVCKTTTCSLMVHKNCLSASAQLDAKGNFVCPFCAYSHTISEYLEAKKIASLARKELAIFISKGIRKEAVDRVHESSRQERNVLRKSYKSEHIPLTENEENREDHAGEHANEVNNFHFERSQQRAPKSVVHSLSLRENENVNNGLAGDVREENESEMLIAKSLTCGRAGQKERPTDKFFCKKINVVCANENNVGEEVPQNMTEHNMAGTVEPVCAHNTVKEEISEDERKKHNISRYSMKFHMDEVQYKTPPSPKIRRKQIPWTAEEEELIREGVQKFSFSDQQLPWKKILAFGSHVFEKNCRRRTPQDLKDKWKNMCKAHSKLKQKALS
ncbi:uncharacterized protein [Cicer arietinum]|uniref:Uncharacterized protein LOC101508857 n=1 Tax=Cicer arietinum TaxID=3827 RepID=A0A1S3DWD4_CICAR|nr:uncharacterized protein LOC101508857 [Cicer arietinum]XP_012567479.1 uncharacterized protein LOC101508857 [Cicer arietinum]